MAYDYEKERREAIDAGNRALYSLRLAEKDLNSAKNWGVFDMVGGGMISSLAKQSKMSDAQKHMQSAKEDLYRFSRELQDVNINANLNLATGDFLSFADWFFDGLAVDWMVQSRIEDAARQVASAIYQVENIMRNLGYDPNYGNSGYGNSNYGNPNYDTHNNGNDYNNTGYQQNTGYRQNYNDGYSNGYTNSGSDYSEGYTNSGSSYSGGYTNSGSSYSGGYTNNGSAGGPFQNNTQYYYDPSLPVRNKILAGVLCLVLGTFGVGNFYLGNIGLGIADIVFCWTGIPSIVNLIRGIIILASSDIDFANKYNCNLS